MDKKSKILEHIYKGSVFRVEDLHKTTGVSKAYIHRLLNTLIQEGKLIKVGKPPIVFYKKAERRLVSTFELKKAQSPFDSETTDLLDKHFVYITPDGILFEGVYAFKQWLDERDLWDKAEEQGLQYKNIRNQAESYRKNGLIEATERLSGIFHTMYLDKVFYSEFWALPQFGKTQLGSILYHAKTTEDIGLMDRVVQQIRDDVLKLIYASEIDSVAYIPPTLPRKTQFMNYLKDTLNVPLPEIKLVKAYKGDVRVPQKSLRSLKERVLNAESTIYIKDVAPTFKRTLLIDDAVGSGSTLNETAKKLKEQGVSREVIGYAIVGSYKGFEVINEV